MSDSNWGKRLAVGLILAVSVLLTIFSYTQYAAALASQKQIERVAQDESQKNAQKSARASDACREIVSAPERQACIAEATNEAERSEREIYDLESQRIMALWTRYMGLAAIIGTTVGIIGIGLVFLTFHATRRTAEIADLNYQAFAKFESAVIVVNFTQNPSFFEENGVRYIRFSLKCANIGRSAAFIDAVAIDGCETKKYSFISKAGEEIVFSGSNRIAVDGFERIRGYVEYSTQVEGNIRRRFKIELVHGEKPSASKAAMFTGGVLRAGDKNYDKPFD